jgi:hypothetical protein
LLGSNAFGGKGLVIARPSSARIKFGYGGEKRGIAAGTMIVSPVIAVPVFARESLLGSFFAADLKLFFGQNFLPFVIAFVCFL